MKIFILLLFCSFSFANDYCGVENFEKIIQNYEIASKMAEKNPQLFYNYTLKNSYFVKCVDICIPVFKQRNCLQKNYPLQENISDPRKLVTAFFVSSCVDTINDVVSDKDLLNILKKHHSSVYKKILSVTI